LDRYLQFPGGQRGEPGRGGGGRRRIAKPEPDPEREGYGFAGWHKNAGGTEPWNFDADTVRENIILYAKWTEKHTVAFVSGDGSDVESVTALDGSTIAQPSNPSLANCAFEGWYRDASYAARWNFATDIVVADITLYARWTVTVSFDANGGGGAPESRTLTRGATITKPEAPVWEGHNFLGWFSAASGGTEYTVWPHPLNGNVTMHAQWHDVSVYTISFDTHGGSAVADVRDNAGTMIPKPADPHWLGHRFLGWFSAASGGAKYDWPHTLRGNLAMHAQWESIAIHTITFDSHGGSPVEAVQDNAGTMVPKPDDPRREGYAFVGWFSAANGGTEYAVWPHALNGDLAMHARWDIKSNNQGIVLTYEDLIDRAGSSLSEPSFSLAKSGGTATKTLSVSGSDNDGAARWHVGLALIHTGSGVTLNAANLSLGRHTLQVTALYGGTLYSKEIPFVVTAAE
jgi:uncharacterized repeat protein (TIGR02543 family)